MRGTFGPGTLVLGGVALLLLGFLAVGMLLPSQWHAQAERLVAAPPGRVMPLVDAPEGWLRWTTWPDSGLSRTGPERGVGASIGWDDPELGSGRFTITDVSPETRVGYSVEVAGAGGGVMTTVGSISMEREAQGTRIRWSEEGDLGGNPLMGYFARSMQRLQSTEMQKGLDRLQQLLPSVDPAPDSIEGR